MINEENTRNEQQEYDAMAALSQRIDLFVLLTEAKELGIQMSYHRTPVDGEYLQWTVLDDKPFEPAIRWMAVHEHHDKLFKWHKLNWHAMNEGKETWVDPW